MRRGVPVFSQAARELCERGPAWREAPAYYQEEPSEGQQALISAFPATGKSYLAAQELGIIDSDSSTFSWKYSHPDVRARHPDWPGNYMTHIREQLEAGARAVLVSTHAEVRSELANQGIGFTLAYPEVGLREEYRERMQRRGSPPALISKVIDELWHAALAECATQDGCEHLVLRAGQYLSDVLVVPDA